MKKNSHFFPSHDGVYFWEGGYFRGNVVGLHFPFNIIIHLPHLIVCAFSCLNLDTQDFRDSRDKKHYSRIKRKNLLVRLRCPRYQDSSLFSQKSA